jgi:hypothetical protein
MFVGGDGYSRYSRVVEGFAVCCNAVAAKTREERKRTLAAV